MFEPYTSERAELGVVKVELDVISSIVSMAAAVVRGVAGIVAVLVSRFSGGFGGGGTGVKVELRRDRVFAEVSIAVEYGAEIRDVGFRVQEHVRDVLERMTGLEVGGVVVNVKGVRKKEETEDG
jgi:uncharacterized alkaline shock family protein YloU